MTIMLLSSLAVLAAVGESQASPQPAIENPQARAEAVQDRAEPVEKKAKLICRPIEVTGSRLPRQKLCLTAKAWAQQRT